MARLLALDWDQREARIVVARPTGDSLAVEKTAAIPLTLSPQLGDHDELAEQLTAALSKAGVSKGQVLTAVGRALIEVDRMHLPPAPPEEMPEMVRFQAMREFTSLQEDSALDFVPLGDAGNEPGEVIAAAISRSLSDEVHSALTSQGHEPHRMVMRSFAVASLAMRRRPEYHTGVGMMIAQQSESAELAVVKNGVVVFTRSFRLPPDWVPGETGEPLLGEVRRTIAAAQNQLGSSRVERILVFGTQSEHADLCDRLRDRTKLEVELLDPFEKVSGDSAPEHPERFAAAIGMLLDEANETAPIIDFLNPRKPPEPESHTQKRLLLGGVAGAVVLAIAGAISWKFEGLNDQIELRTAKLAKVQNDNKKLEPTVQLANELRKWKEADRNWLDVLSHLSEIEGLTADDFILDSVSGRTTRDGRAVIDIQGKTRDLKSRQQLQVGWSDDHHWVSPEMSTPNRGNADSRYPKMFEAMIRTDNSIPIVELDASGLPVQRPAPSADESIPAESTPSETDESPPDEKTPSEDALPDAEADPEATSAPESNEEAA